MMTAEECVYWLCVVGSPSAYSATRAIVDRDLAAVFVCAKERVGDWGYWRSANPNEPFAMRALVDLAICREAIRAIRRERRVKEERET